MSPPARVLIVGGHDPSGAGLDADLIALRGLEVEGLTVVTARTDQDASRVRSVGARDLESWVREARELSRGGIAAIKFGLLPGAAHVLAARDLLRELRGIAGKELPAIVDPVIRASSGGTFLDAEAVETMGELTREGVILTPNLSEAAELAGVMPEDLGESLEARRTAAQILLDAGARAVIVKGGHGAEDPVRDLIVMREGKLKWLTRPRIAGGSIRGSGCRFASRLAARLALGASLEAAAEEAGTFVAGEIARAASARRTAKS
ncbi:MAG: hydroxymethylpyrimidine/phosphomethylpyrimidine kinase [Planctomycetota bacterium]